MFCSVDLRVRGGWVGVDWLMIMEVDGGSWASSPIKMGREEETRARALFVVVFSSFITEME